MSLSLKNADVILKHKIHDLPDHNSILDVYASTNIVIVKRCQTAFAASLAQCDSSILFLKWW